MLADKFSFKVVCIFTCFFNNKFYNMKTPYFICYESDESTIRKAITEAGK